MSVSGRLFGTAASRILFAPIFFFFEYAVGSFETDYWPEFNPGREFANRWEIFSFKRAV
jgi:hypothetical protein